MGKLLLSQKSELRTSKKKNHGIMLDDTISLQKVLQIFSIKISETQKKRNTSSKIILFLRKKMVNIPLFQTKQYLS